MHDTSQHKEKIEHLTILQALALSNDWHLWSIVLESENVQIDFCCKKKRNGECRYHSYWMKSQNGRSANCDRIECVVDVFKDTYQHEFLGRISLSQEWIFYGIEKYGEITNGNKINR